MTEIAKTKDNPFALVLEAQADQLADFIGEKNLKRFAAAVLSQVSRTPGLKKCSPDSFFRAAHKCAMLGLMPGPGDEVYLIPYGKECNAQVGYKGMLKMARRHPDVLGTPDAQLVYRGDEFSYDAANAKLTHAPALETDRSPENIIGAWSMVEIRGSARPSILVLTRQEIESRRARSQQSNGNFWRNDYAAMARKTVIRAHYNGGSVPLSDELAQVIAEDLEREDIRRVDAKVTSRPTLEDKLFGDPEPVEETEGPHLHALEAAIAELATLKSMRADCETDKNGCSDEIVDGLIAMTGSDVLDMDEEQLGQALDVVNRRIAEERGE